VRIREPFPQPRAQSFFQRRPPNVEIVAYQTVADTTITERSRVARDPNKRECSSCVSTRIRRTTPPPFKTSSGFLPPGALLNFTAIARLQDLSHHAHLTVTLNFENALFKYDIVRPMTKKRRDFLKLAAAGAAVRPSFNTYLRPGDRTPPAFNHPPAPDIPTF